MLEKYHLMKTWMTMLLLLSYSSRVLVTNATNSSKVIATNSSQVFQTDVVLSRKRRFVAFPEGSSFTVAVCHTVGVIGNPNPSYLSYGLNWGMAYDLPNTTWVLTHANGFANYPPKTKPVIHKRRYKRELFRGLEEGVEK